MTEFQVAAAAETKRLLTALHERLTAAREEALGAIIDPSLPAAEIAKRRATILADAVTDAAGMLSFLLTSEFSPLPQVLSGGAS